MTIPVTAAGENWHPLTMIAPENQSGYLDHSPLSRHFADFIIRLHGTPFPALYLASFLLCDSERQGHVCIDLHLLGKQTFYTGAETLESPEGAVWNALLRESPLVGAPGDVCPLILDDAGRLYTYRYWHYERSVADHLLKRSQAFMAPSISPADCGRILNRLFPDFTPDQNHSRIPVIAAFISLTRQLCLIAGGPGTGKTTALTRILAFLLEAKGKDKERIAIAAPTAKAAMRLQESIAQVKTALSSPLWVKNGIPKTPVTLHRLLGANREGTSYQYGHHSPLPYDIVVVDEASMVDMAMMFHLLDALPVHAKLILLGDQHQLPAVNAGSVVWDILASGIANHYSRTFSQLLSAYIGMKEGILNTREKEGITDCMVEFRKNYRIPEDTPLEYLRRSVTAGNAEEALRLLENGGNSLKMIHLSAAYALETYVKEEIGVYLRQYARHITDHDDIDKIFHAFDSFRVLCATRAGLFGVDFLNGIMEGFLKNDMDVPPNRFLYPGKAIMITENDYTRQLFNGDIGILLSDPEAPDHWSFYFRTLENTNLFRKVSPYSLPGHETAFAMTIHKSQGSEYDQVFLFLPQHHSPVLTRELLYTGITRSKKGLAIVAAKDIFTAALAHRNRRHSGLTEKLRKG